MNSCNGVLEAMNGVMGELGAIGKDSVNQHQHYKFRGIDAVYNTMHPLLAKYGLCIVPDVTSAEFVDRETAKGTAMVHARLLVRFTIYAKDGSSVSGCTAGEAMDSADKAANKAMAAATKYFYFIAFCIGTLDEQDADSVTPAESRQLHAAGGPSPSTSPPTPPPAAPPHGADPDLPVGEPVAPLPPPKPAFGPEPQPPHQAPHIPPPNVDMHPPCPNCNSAMWYNGEKVMQGWRGPLYKCKASKYEPGVGESGCAGVYWSNQKVTEAGVQQAQVVDMASLAEQVEDIPF